MSEGPLTGQVAVITGASKGLGRALSRALISDGVRVGLIARASDALDETAAELGAAALPCPCDIRSTEDVRNALARIAAHFGRIDILINNAAACLVNSAEAVPDEAIRVEVDTNFVAPIVCTREVIPYLRGTGTGHIINISSESSVHPFPLLTVYAATKAGLETFTTGLRDELRPHNIRVTLLRSGHMTTSVVEQWNDDQKQAFFSAYAGSDAASKAGPPLDPGTTAAMIVSILKLPKDANVRLIELGGR